MANELSSNVSQIVLKEILPLFVNDTVSAKTVNRQIVGDGKINPDTGDRISVKRPTRYKSERTSGGDISGLPKSDIKVGNADAIVQDYITVSTAYANLEEAIQLNQLGKPGLLKSLLGPMATEMVITLETALNDFMVKNLAHQLGLANTPITLWSEVAKVEAFAHEFGFPKDRQVMCQINSFEVANLADKQAALLNNNLTGTAWELARLSSNVGGVNYFKSNALSVVDNGTFGTGNLTLGATPIQTYVGTKDSYETTLVISGLPLTQTGALKAGDIIQVTQANRSYLQQSTRAAMRGEQGNEVPYTAVVTADVNSDGSGDATVVVGGPAIFETGVAGAFNTIKTALASGDTVEVISGTSAGSTKPDLFYHKDAIGLSFVRIPKLTGGVITSSANLDGFNMRVSMYADGDKNEQTIRIDMLPAFAAFNQLMGGHLYGGTTPNS